MSGFGGEKVVKKRFIKIAILFLVCVLGISFSACSVKDNVGGSASNNLTSASSTSKNSTAISSSANSSIYGSASDNSVVKNSASDDDKTFDSSSSSGESSKDEEGEKYSEKGIFFSSFATVGGDGSFEKPYNSLEKISAVEFEAGTHIYLERGSKFLGSLAVSDAHGTKNEPIVVTAYGEGEKPKIDGNDLSGGGVLYISNCDNLIVEQLELFDSATSEGDRRGALITCDNNKGTEEVVTYKNITLKDLYIHDINGFRDAENSGMAMESKITGGIHVWSNDGLGRVDGLNIVGCEISNVSNVGIATWYHVERKDSGSVTVKKVSPYDGYFNNYAHLNVLIKDNEINFIGKNAIFARHLYGGVIEYNVIHDTAIHCVSGNTIVTSYVDGTIVQYNEGYRNMASPRASDGKYQDGCMLDADLASKDTVWQYNYSHDNSFGLFINCTYNNSTMKDVVTVRYNLSVNDKGNKGIIYINYASNGIYVYNNTIVTAYDTQYIIQSNLERKSYFYNNIIYNRSSSAKFDAVDGSWLKGSNNLIYNESGASISGLDYFKSINADGIYDKNPAFLGSIPKDSVLGIENQNAYMLNSNSPALGVGKTVAEVSDFFGNAYKKSIGFYCGN